MSGTQKCVAKAAVRELVLSAVVPTFWHVLTISAVSQISGLRTVSNAFLQSLFVFVKASCRNRIALALSLSTCWESVAYSLSRNCTKDSSGPCKILVKDMLELMPAPGCRCRACRAR